MFKQLTHQNGGWELLQLNLIWMRFNLWGVILNDGGLIMIPATNHGQMLLALLLRPTRMRWRLCNGPPTNRTLPRLVCRQWKWWAAKRLSSFLSKLVLALSTKIGSFRGDTSGNVWNPFLFWKLGRLCIQSNIAYEVYPILVVSIWFYQTVFLLYVRWIGVVVVATRCVVSHNK